MTKMRHEARELPRKLLAERATVDVQEIPCPGRAGRDQNGCTKERAESSVQRGNQGNAQVEADFDLDRPQRTVHRLGFVPHEYAGQSVLEEVQKREVGKEIAPGLGRGGKRVERKIGDTGANDQTQTDRQQIGGVDPAGALLEKDAQRAAGQVALHDQIPADHKKALHREV